MKILIVLLSLASLATAKPVADAYAPVFGYYTNPIAAAKSGQFHAQDEFGQYHYGYNNADSGKEETKSADGVVQGAYTYVDANGVLQTTRYISDALGFRVAATNLPVAPVAEAVEIKAPEVVAQQIVPAVEATQAVETVQKIEAVPATQTVQAVVPTIQTYQTVQAAPVAYAQAIVPQVNTVQTYQTAQVSVAQPVLNTVQAYSNNILVPQVSYAHLPYATSFPYYINQAQAYSYVAQPTPVEAPKEVTQAEIVQAAPQVYAVQPVAAVAEPVQKAQEIITVPIHTQYHSQDELGQYQFGYSDASSSRTEAKSADGVVSGSYNYVDSNGKIQTVQYVADSLGFRAAGSAIPVASGELPSVVQDTPEVIAARSEHLKLVAEAEAYSATETTPTPEEISEPVPEAVLPSVTDEPTAGEPVVPEQGAIVANTYNYLPVQTIVQPQTYVSAQSFVQPQAYVSTQTFVQQPQTYVSAQPQVYVTAAQPVAQQTYGVAQPIVPLPQVVVQPALAQPSLAGQPVAVSKTVEVAQAQVAQGSNQFHAQDELGQYEYGYANEHSFKTEQRLADGTVRGTYSYIDANGVVQQVNYISDALGFRVAATNLPQVPVEGAPAQELPAVPEVPVVADPAPIHTTPAAEVEAQPVPAETTPVEVDDVPATVEAADGPAIVPLAYNPAVIQQNQYIVPATYSANYAPVYQPYASAYGYYVHPFDIGNGRSTHTQHHAQDELGQYNYGYTSSDSAKNEIKTADGIVRGSYSYVDANGIVQTTNYVSDEWGFKVEATNLPVAVAPAASA